MGRKTSPLSDAQLRRFKPAEKEYREFDGNGLFISIKPNGRKVWRVDYRLNGKRKTYTIGDYPSITLAQARNIAVEVKQKAKEGVDPVEDRKARMGVKIEPRKLTFKDVAEQFLRFKESEYSLSHFMRQNRRVELYLYPVLGDIPIDEIDKQKLIEVIQGVPYVDTPSTKSSNKLETARRIYTLLSQIYKYGLQHDLVQKDVMAHIDVNTILPKSTGGKIKALVKADEIRDIYGLIQEYQGDISTAMALRFLALTAMRPGNVRGLKWEYIDFNNDVIEYPAEVMKNKRPYRLPLTPTLTYFIDRLKPLTRYKSEYVFCSPIAPTKQLSENTLNYAHKRMGITEHNAHGWRSAFSTICYENQRDHGFSFEVIESQLAHTVGGSVKMAYLRSDFLVERQQLLLWWEDFLSR